MVPMANVWCLFSSVFHVLQLDLHIKTCVALSKIYYEASTEIGSKIGPLLILVTVVESARLFDSLIEYMGDDNTHTYIVGFKR